MPRWRTIYGQLLTGVHRVLNETKYNKKIIEGKLFISWGYSSIVRNTIFWWNDSPLDSYAFFIITSCSGNPLLIYFDFIYFIYSRVPNNRGDDYCFWGFWCQKFRHKNWILQDCDEQIQHKMLFEISLIDKEHFKRLFTPSLVIF